MARRLRTAASRQRTAAASTPPGPVASPVARVSQNPLAQAFGHTGFTGTSLVLDPSADRWAVLLTNRVHPSREAQGFETVRAQFHRLVG